MISTNTKLFSFLLKVTHCIFGTFLVPKIKILGCLAGNLVSEKLVKAENVQDNSYKKNRKVPYE